MTATTVVRFRDVTQQPDYEATHPRSEKQLPHVPHGFMRSVAGQTVSIYVKPVEPRAHTCGVERVWMVPDAEVERLTGRPPVFGVVVVCEHQVEID